MQRVADALEAIDRCSRYVDSLDNDNPDLVAMAEDAIERNLQVIGEAVKHLPSDLTDGFPEIAWPQIRAFATSPSTATSVSIQRSCVT